MPARRPPAARARNIKHGDVESSTEVRPRPAHDGHGLGLRLGQWVVASFRRHASLTDLPQGLAKTRSARRIASSRAEAAAAAGVLAFASSAAGGLRRGVRSEFIVREHVGLAPDPPITARVWRPRAASRFWSTHRRAPAGPSSSSRGAAYSTTANIKARRSRSSWASGWTLFASSSLSESEDEESSFFCLGGGRILSPRSRSP